MNLHKDIHTAQIQGTSLLAILIDPDKFVAEYAFAKAYLEKTPSQTTHFLVGGSSDCPLYTSPSPRDGLLSRMPSSA